MRLWLAVFFVFFFFQAEDGIRDLTVTGVQTCALPIWMGSMMAPSVVLRDGGLELAIGAAGGTRLRSALIEVAAGVLDEGLPAGEAVARPRLHAAGGRVQLEPGFSDATVSALERKGFEVRVWPAQHHFFGGVSLVTPSDAAGDPRRSGAAAQVR